MDNDIRNEREFTRKTRTCKLLVNDVHNLLNFGLHLKTQSLRLHAPKD